LVEGPSPAVAISSQWYEKEKRVIKLITIAFSLIKEKKKSLMISKMIFRLL